MTKSGYFSTSGKLLMISSILLLVSNIAVFASGYNTNIVSWSTKISDITFYLVFLFVFLAFNGEGIGYKTSRDLKKKKITKYLKFLLFITFVMRFIKKPFEVFLLSFATQSIFGTTIRLFLGGFNAVVSYGFLFTVASVFYCLRDKKFKILHIVEATSLIVGVINTVFKMLNYAVTKYGLLYVDDVFVEFFSNRVISSMLIIMQFAVNAIMFVFIMKTYSEFLSEEQFEKEKIAKKMNFAVNIYNSCGYGVDNLEDEYLSVESQSE